MKYLEVFFTYIMLIVFIYLFIHLLKLRTTYIFCIFKLSHFNVPPQITFLFLILEKNVSDKSCMALRKT